MALTYLKQGVGDEKRSALGFFGTNREHFSKEDAVVFSAVFAAMQATDKNLANLAEEILASWGYDRDNIKSDKELR